MCGGLRSPSGLCSSQGVAQRLILLRCNLDLESRKSDDSKSWAVLHRTSAPYVLSTSGQLRGRCASRCSSHLGWGNFCQCGGPMYDREVRRSEIRKFASEGTKQGGDNHQTTILDLVRPTAHELSRAGFPPPLNLPCCGTYLQGGNGVDVHGDSAALYPADCRDQRPRVLEPGLLVGSGMDTQLRGFLHAEPGARLQKMADSGALMLRFRGGDRERSSTRKWQLGDTCSEWDMVGLSRQETPNVIERDRVHHRGRRGPFPVLQLARALVVLVNASDGHAPCTWTARSMCASRASVSPHPPRA